MFFRGLWSSCTTQRVSLFHQAVSGAKGHKTAVYIYIDDITVMLLHVWELHGNVWELVAAAVLQSFFKVLLDEGITTKAVFHKWESTTAQQGKDNSNSGWFLHLSARA